MHRKELLSRQPRWSQDMQRQHRAPRSLFPYGTVVAGGVLVLVEVIVVVVVIVEVVTGVVVVVEVAVPVEVVVTGMAVVVVVVVAVAVTVMVLVDTVLDTTAVFVRVLRIVKKGYGGFARAGECENETHTVQGETVCPRYEVHAAAPDADRPGETVPKTCLKQPSLLHVAAARASRPCGHEPSTTGMAL